MYQPIIAACAEITRHDTAFVRVRLDAAIETITQLLKATGDLRADAGEIADNDQLDAAVLADTERELNEIMDILQGARRDVDRQEEMGGTLTISLLGRTKAGKSTLAAALTGKGFEGIGRGKQRTTRENRVYNWEGLRLVDTPGTDAPQVEGNQDTILAKSVIAESDIACVVMTDNSQQLSELDLLVEIRGRNKPVVVVLNAKRNLGDPSYMQDFLENPEHWIEGKSGQDIRDHIGRIQRYLLERGLMRHSRTIPLQILAGFLAHQPDFQQHAVKLYGGSNLQEFRNVVDVLIREAALLHRSQNLLDGARYQLGRAEMYLEQLALPIGALAEQMRPQERNTAKQLDETFERHRQNLRRGIDNIFSDLREGLYTFVNEAYDDSEPVVRERLRSYIKSKAFEVNLGAEVKKHFALYGQEVEEDIGEAVGNLNFSFLSSREFNVETSDTFNWQSLLQGIGTSLVATGIALDLTGIGVIAGLPLDILGGALALISGIFESGEEVRAKAVQRLYASICRNLDEWQGRVIYNAEAALDNCHNQVKSATCGKFRTASDRLSGLHNHLIRSKDEVQRRVSQLDLGLAYRTINFARFRHEAPPLISLEEIRRIVVGVHREFGRSMSIEATVAISTDDCRKLSAILCEDIVVKKAS